MQSDQGLPIVANERPIFFAFFHPRNNCEALLEGIHGVGGIIRFAER